MALQLQIEALKQWPTTSLNPMESGVVWRGRNKRKYTVALKKGWLDEWICRYWWL